MYILIMLLFLGVLALLACIVTAIWYLRQKSERKRVCVVVLGDIGRSPRMQYHCLSLAKRDFLVDFVGYGGAKPHEDILKNGNIERHLLKELPPALQGLPRLIVYVLKTVWQTGNLLYMMVRLQRPSHILIQNPPAIPTLFVAFVIAYLRKSKLIVDWHNYGYTILGLTLGPGHPLVRFSKWYEELFGKNATSSICVTNAMRLDLLNRWNIRAVTLYDRPPAMFQETSLADQHTLFSKLSTEYEVFKSRKDQESETAFTKIDDSGNVTELVKRPALIVSSTSWTEDEDFSVLLGALEEYEKAADENKNLPDVICAITGKGPQKSYYQGLIKQKNFNHIQICTPWLEAEDYPKLLGAADLGVCLHKSSSGLDLPMKVVDMFGCGLPVCAIHFNCLHELVKHEKNGYVFHHQGELASQLQNLLEGFPRKKKMLEIFRKNLKPFQDLRWEENWSQNVAELFLQ